MVTISDDHLSVLHPTDPIPLSFHLPFPTLRHPTYIYRGSYHESWLRVQEPSQEIAACCEKIRKHYHLEATDVNSVVVNYYFDGN